MFDKVSDNFAHSKQYINDEGSFLAAKVAFLLLLFCASEKLYETGHLSCSKFNKFHALSLPSRQG